MKEKKRKVTFIRIIKLINILLMTYLFSIVWFKCFSWRLTDPFFYKGNYYVVFIFMLLYIVLVQVYDGLMISYSKFSELVYSQMLSASISLFFMYLLIILLVREYTVNPIPLIMCLIGQFFVSIIWSWLAQKIYFKIYEKRKSAIIIGNEREVSHKLSEFYMDSKFTILKIIKIDEILHNHEDMLEGIDTVFFVDVHSKDRNEIMKYCVQNNILCFVIPRIGDTLMMSAESMHFFHLPIFRVTKYNPKIEYLIVKRLIDIIASLLGIIILSPVMIIVAIFVKSDGGPVFYKQVRLTQNGKKFKVLKFRSMRVNAESNGKAVLSAGENDPRITKVGRVIRAIRFDELPQLINILKGDMTIVGPRPERPEIAEEYYETIPEFRLRLQCKAGLTGYAQVYGKYNTEPYDKLLMDLMYIAKPSLLEDLRIIFATVKILFVKDSTEGIDVNQDTAMK
ncbi:exopolysaccharide biosynthesis polyprenyl glycosylphosphotransferase [Kandleria vitulina]|uniref:exopolysaccharide biosynthesis polyprenyl glycosylphosphotransferase n=1 Tax=Kandleria vitulina TaxID=1630 RepID=UPI0004E208CC|nr:exopolysaccharide biosynthesis polyprenyl glycosylphosphotransferase [Kandleria vitulina]